MRAEHYVDRNNQVNPFEIPLLKRALPKAIISRDAWLDNYVSNIYPISLQVLACLFSGQVSVPIRVPKDESLNPLV